MKKIVYMSQFRDSSGYAIAARGYLKALDAYLQENPGAFELKVHTFNVEKEKDLSDHMLDLLKKYEFTSLNELKKFVREDYILLWHMPPPMVVTFTGGLQHREIQWEGTARLVLGANHKINLTVWEADRIPTMWEELYYKNTSTNDVIVPSDWNKEIFDSCLEDVKCHKVTHLLDSERIMTDPVPMNLPVDLDDKFVVFSMSQWNNRKGFDKLIQAFCMEFGHQEDVVLLIKTYLDNTKYFNADQASQHKMIAEEITAYKNSVFLDKEERPTSKVMVIPGVLPYENISWLYNKSDVFALLTRGEGFGFTVAEAMMYKKPVIAPGQDIFFDYIDSEAIAKDFGQDPNLNVEGHWSPYVNRPGYSCNSNWYEPHLLSARKSLRTAYNLWKNDKESFDKLGESYYNSVMKSESFKETEIGRQLFEIFETKWSDTESSAVELEDDDTTPPSRIKDITSNLKWEMQKIDNPVMSQRRLDLLKDSFKGETCYILNCGPSLNEYSKEFLEEFLQDKLTIAVKQAYYKAPNAIDFHVFNCSNLPKQDKLGCYYNYFGPEQKRPITVASSNYDYGVRWQAAAQECDLFFKVPIRTQINNEFLVRTLDFDKYTMRNTINRPCGPGIMYETVIYLAEHLGVKEIVALGWDLSTKEKSDPSKYKHFYGTSKDLTNRGDILGWEIEETRAATEPLTKWLRSKDIELKLVSTQSSLWDGIERIRLDDE